MRDCDSARPHGRKFRNLLDHHLPRPVTAALAALLLAGALAPTAGAVQPGRKHATTPDRMGLRYERVAFPAADSLEISGWWLPSTPDAPVLVMAPRGHGTMADLLPSVAEFQQRGFAVLTFDYRDFGPQGFDADSLRYVVFASRWVDDMVGALRYARSRAPAGTHVFAWGQGMGGSVALAAAARRAGLCDALVVEGLITTSQEQVRLNGTSTIAGVVEQHHRLVRADDEPLSAAASLRVPMLVILSGKDDVTPTADTQRVISRSRARVDRLPFPEAGHEGAERTPGYYDRVSHWLKRWLVFPAAG